MLIAIYSITLIIYIHSSKGESHGWALLMLLFKMKKKTYLSPEIELVEFNLRNVIATSGGSIGHDPENPDAAPRRPNAIWE